MSRAEYLHLLRTAKVLGKEKAYLLVKVLALTGLLAGVESNIFLLVEQATGRILEQEQFSAGWEEKP